MNNVRSLTGMRGYAAFFVFLSHLYHFEYFHIQDPWRSYVSTLGGTGVSLFFALSGFVLILNYPSARSSAKDFYLARLARIYPAYLLGVLLSVPFEILSKEKSGQVVAFLACILLVQQYHPATDGRFNDVGWTLGVESFFYLLFPLLAFHLFRDSIRRALAFTAGALVLSICLIVTCGSTFYGYHRFPPIRLYEFSIGMTAGLIYLQFKPEQVRRWSLGVLVTATVGLFMAPLFTAAGPLMPYKELIDGTFGAGIIWGMATYERIGHLPMFLVSKVALIAGEISYAFYLIHNLILRYFSHGMKAMFHIDVKNIALHFQILSAVGIFAITVIFSWLTFQYIEKPMRKWIRNLPRPRRAD